MEKINKSNNDVNNENLDNIEEMRNFDDDLCEYFNGDLIFGINCEGYEKPSAIQSKVTPYILQGRDVIAQAQAGSGKTGAYLFPAIARINVNNNYPQVLIICNTRPLATQINCVAESVGSKVISDHGLKIQLCIGGNTPESHVDLDKVNKTHLLIGTPGKVMALSEMNTKSRLSSAPSILDKITLLILDEADILLENEFVLQIKSIIKKISKTAQICLFSATYPKSVLEITNKFLSNPVKILVENEKISVDGIKNFWVNVGKEGCKYDTLVDIYHKISVCQAVIFVNSVEKANDLSNALKKDGHTVGVIHSRMDEIEKVKVLSNFRKTGIRVLVATDLISRGIDVQQVGLVINYDVPANPDKYIHRVGRSGRYGKVGVAITFMVQSRQDTFRMEEIEKKYHIDFKELEESKDVDMVNNYLIGKL
jgi:superfamily II DNA/RNA helicase